MNTDDKGLLLSKEDLKQEIEITIKFELCDQHDCMVCINQNVGCFDVFTTTASSGTPVLAFLNKFTKIDQLSRNSDKYICKSCLELINDLEHAEKVYVKLKNTFELIIAKNPLLRLPWSDRKEREITIQSYLSNDSENESVLVQKNYGVDIKTENLGECSKDAALALKLELIEQKGDTVNTELGETSQIGDIASTQTSQDKQPDGSTTDRKENQSQESTVKVPGQGLHKCEVCQRQFKQRSDMIRHLRTHTGERPFKCELCQHRFIDSSTLITHSRVHTGEKPYKCDICEYRCSVKQTLYNHKRTHTGEKPYKCDVCQKGFSQRNSLSCHLRTHTGEKPYKCEVCQRRFNESSKLSIHSRIHKGEKPYKCDQCQYKCVEKKALLTHKRTHTGEKPFKCQYCQKGFSQNHSLQYHIKTHTGEKPFGCDFCEYRCREKRHLMKHLRAHSGDEYLQKG